MGGVFLYYSSLYWISAVVFLSGTIITGSSRLICKTFDPAALWHLIETYKVRKISIKLK